MATYFKIFKDTLRECGIDTVPSTAQGQTGELLRFANWVIDAYTEIQDARHWRWLRKKFTVNTVDGTSVYAFGDCTDVEDSAVITRFKMWRLDDQRNPPTVYLSSTGVGGETFVSYTSFDGFNSLYNFGSLQNQTGFPIHITVNPNNEIELGLTPGAVYVLRGEYHRSAQILSADADTPEMPTDYHSLIKYQAMMFYGQYESAPEIVDRADTGINKIMRQLIRNQGQSFRLGGPLA